MTDIGRSKRRLLLRTNEGCVPWIYPDGAGNPTVGVGHLLRTVKDAIALPFVVKTGKPATVQQIAAAWASVRHTGKPYRDLILLDPDINALLDRDLDEREPIMQRAFGGLELPESVELALWDILFNTGNFEEEWPNLTAAVRAGDWARAAAESKRKEGNAGVSAQRNELTRALFLEALKPQEEVNA